MDKDIDQSYSVYTNAIKRDLEKDAFYQYFHNLIECGSKYYKFSNKKLFKYVDSVWVDEIEQAIEHLEASIENPRKFIEEDRQIVNVALAKSITPESIQHLTMHGDMVDAVREDGTVIPNRILNIFKEESLNTYENRFIATLLQELLSFVNRRVDVIFENTKDELGGVLDIETTIDNYKEIINYKMQIRIEEKQTTVENDRQNKDIFGRIARIHRRVNDMANSNFYAAMRQYPTVKHPVVKTNAIAKNPHYKACYALWNFLHTYDRVGYKVRVFEQDPIITRNFERDVNNDIFLEYLVLKKFMEDSDFTNIHVPKQEPDRNPKFIRQLMEEILDYYGNMSDAEVKKRVMKELSNAQLDRRAAIRKEEWARKNETSTRRGR
ncbi:DUF2357 domain-containing protein [Anaerosporobacter faecicola]|uniref:DUF2357 domain-containing protein n=1 Tax=Anaerosporobacter faecicola TaxID=2718714 RepID=UPI0014387894|nr:DUF2357 domain-containing protein [Anaerosporobacter faecicola]